MSQNTKRIPPGPGQESVWDYPRPPRLEASSKRIQVFFAGQEIASTIRSFRILETSHPPAYYLPRDDVRMEYFRPVSNQSFCEWKGKASYFDVVVGNKLAPASAWTYERPSPNFLPIAGYLAFYPGRMERCLVDGETVRPQAGSFYGGWITDEIVGPFKGEPGTMFW
jgi:uncharacterized protein (DUF427 family)